MNDQALFIFKLRHNIVLDGDLALARMELDAFFPTPVQDIARMAALPDEFPQLGGLRGLEALDSLVRPQGVQALRAVGPLSLLVNLVRSLSFVQRIYCVTQAAGATRTWLVALEQDVQAVLASRVVRGSLVVQAIPHYALFELSSVVARRSQGPEETKRNLDAVLAALLSPSDQPGLGAKLAQAALSTRSTTSHLSHDLHYYKAKFFPRLARSVLNICARRLGDGPHRVLDPFVGSGTTLLEAATLGIPGVGLDIDPLSVLISRTKLSAARLDSGLLAEEAARAIKVLGAPDQGRPGPTEDERPVTFPAWLMKNRKMTAEIAQQLGQEIHTLQAATAACAPPISSLFRVLISDAISRRIRMRFLGTGVGRFSLTFAKTPAPQIFARSLKRYVKTAATFEWLRDTVRLQLAEAPVIEADARHLPDGLGKFDILLTSPPYLPASSGRESYAKARAPSLIALGMKDHYEIDQLVDGSVGSMGGYRAELAELTDDERHLVEWLRCDSLRAIKAEPTARYFMEMRQAFVEMARVLQPDGLAVVVSGKQSTFYNFSTRETLYVVRSAEMLADEAERAGLLVDDLHDVQLQKSNMNARPRSLDDYYETLIVLRKPG